MSEVRKLRAGEVLKRYPGMAPWVHKNGDTSHEVSQHYDGRPGRVWVCYACDEVIVLGEPT